MVAWDIKNNFEHCSLKIGRKNNQRKTTAFLHWASLSLTNLVWTLSQCLPKTELIGALYLFSAEELSLLRYPWYWRSIRQRPIWTALQRTTETWLPIKFTPNHSSFLGRQNPVHERRANKKRYLSNKKRRTSRLCFPVFCLLSTWILYYSQRMHCLKYVAERI